VQLIAVGLKAFFGGVLVVAFSALSDVIQPKAFAGVFSAAPSVALASLGVTSLVSGPEKAQVASTGMIAGAVGMIAYCVAATFLVRRFGAVAGSVLAWVAWAIPALVLYWVWLS